MLTFNLKKEWFDKIKSGEKTHEYREVKPYWTKRILTECSGVGTKDKRYKKYEKNFTSYLNKGFSFPQFHPTICFMNGMETEEKNPRIYAKMKLLRQVNGKTTDLKIDKPVYDIEFEVIK